MNSESPGCIGLCPVYVEWYLHGEIYSLTHLFLHSFIHLMTIEEGFSVMASITMMANVCEVLMCTRNDTKSFARFLFPVESPYPLCVAYSILSHFKDEKTESHRA